MQRERYFDNAATTPVDDRVVAAMRPYFDEFWGNAHSIHQAGSEAMSAVESARESIARLIGAESPEEIAFTSGATESNNWLLRSFPECAVSPFEHSSLYEAARSLGNPLLANEGHELTDKSNFVSLMKVNNETGTIFRPEGITEQVHSDITQAAGKILVNVSEVDFASLSAHKLYGPKGVGALYAKGGAFPSPLLIGGDQESGARAGTLNVPGIVGMGEAARIAMGRLDGDNLHAAKLRGIVLESLAKTPDFRVNGGSNVSPYILSISFYGMEGESVVIEMDRLGFAISSGAACSSRSTEPSHVLTNLGIPTEWLRGTIRISFGRFNTCEAAQELGKSLTSAVRNLRKLTV